LAHAIRSALDQTHRDLELLVLDNSSTDATADVVRGFVDARLRYIRHPPATIAGARNLGIREATGDYVAYLDDDDEWLPDKTERQLSLLVGGSSRLGLVYGGFVRVDTNGAEFETHAPALRGRVLEALLWQRDAFTGSASNPMMPTRVMRSLGGYNDAITTSEDWELYLRLAERYDVDYVPETVVRIRAHRGSRLGDRIREAGHVEEMVLERYKATMPPRLLSFYLQKIGGKLCRTGSIVEGRERIRDAIRVNRFNGVAYLQFVASYLGHRRYQQIHAYYKRLF